MLAFAPHDYNSGSRPCGRRGESIMAASFRTVGAVLFPGFELLDVYGPLEMFGALPDAFRIVTLGRSAGPVASAQGPRGVIDRALEDPGPIDVLLVPGGIGTRAAAADHALLAFLRGMQPSVEWLASVCTGAGVLAASGVLDGRRATTNKMVFDWPQRMGPRVHWVPEARWVVDGNIATSSGVTAGMDMALDLIARMHDEATAVEVARYAEYQWHRDANLDPFAKLAGLV